MSERGANNLNRIMYDTQKLNFNIPLYNIRDCKHAFKLQTYFLKWPFVRFPGHTSLQIKERRPKGAKYCLSLEAWRCVRHDSVDSVSHFPRPGLQVTRPHIGCRACPETGEATWQPGDNQNICSNIFFDITCILWYVAPMCSVFEQFWSRFLSCIHFGHFCHWNWLKLITDRPMVFHSGENLASNMSVCK